MNGLSLGMEVFVPQPKGVKGIVTGILTDGSGTALVKLEGQTENLSYLQVDLQPVGKPARVPEQTAGGWIVPPQAPDPAPNKEADDAEKKRLRAERAKANLAAGRAKRKANLEAAKAQGK